MYQNIILIGNVGREPELRYTPAGKAVASFTLATTERLWRPDDKSEALTAWWNITCWGLTAERVAEKVKKGAKLLVEGRVKPGEDGNPRTYTRKDGTTGTSYELTASVVRRLDHKPNDDGYTSDEEVDW